MLKNYEEVKAYLIDDPETALYIARDLNAWDSRFPWLDTWDLSELIACMCCDYDSTRNFVDILLNSLGTLDSDNEQVRFNAYGRQLESVTDKELYEEVIDAIDELIEGIEEEYPSNISIDDNELKELLSELEN